MDHESFIVKCKDFDSSSKLCFEEKSNKVIYDKIFQKIASRLFQMQSWFPWPNAQSHSPRKEMPKISLVEPKCQRKSKNQGVLKSMKKVQNTTLENGFSIKKKSNSSLPKPIYTYCGPKQSHCAIASLGETLQR